MRTLSVRLDDQTDALLRAFCARTGKTQSEVVAISIAALSAQSESPGKLAEDFGLVGGFDSGVGDLGCNHSQHLHEKLTGRHRG